jgi:hypothetical protein
MTFKMNLLAAAAAVALPAAFVSAQTTAPMPRTPPPATNAPTTQATTPPTPDASATEATEQADRAANAADQQADAVEADATQQAQAQPATPPADPAAPAASQPTDSGATTTTTTTTATAQPGATSIATAADVRAGAQVHDQTGGLVGTVESADANGAVVATGTVRARLPISSFARNDQGLVIGMTKAQLEAAAAQAARPS